MVQLQLLDLMIPKDCGAVPIDAATRADLIDLMARVLVAVFHEELPGSRSHWRIRPVKRGSISPAGMRSPADLSV